MNELLPIQAEVFSPRELALAANVEVAAIRALIAAGQVHTIDGEFMTGAEAVRVGRTLLGRSVEALVPQAQSLLAPPPASKRKAGMPLAVSTMAHAAMLVMAVVVTTSGLTQEERKPQDMPPAQPLRMVYLAKPGPGGGGGGGGRLEKKAPPKIQRKAPVERKVSAPAPPVRPAPPAVVPVAKPPEPPPPVKASPLPAVVAPVASVPADSHDRVGVVAQSPAVEASHGPGSGGGVGSGKGTGVGEGDGPGLGPGSGGGTGGGPYRPGSGIEAPRLLREFKPDYTEEARQRGIEGDVVMEIVVRRDGSVGEVKVLQGLGYGLDRRATDAVRQWKFAPAKRLGSPVDVMVEVAMEFKLR